MKLHLAKDLQLPLEAVTESLGFLGRKGSGKSYTGHKLAEEMYRCKIQFVALDPVGIWYGLRLAADGKSPGLPIPVLGGLHGDIPLEATGGALIADLVVDRGVSVVLDVSQFESDADKARFARAFADRFFFRKKASPSAVHVFLEECQEFVPQNPQREEALMLHAFTRMAKIGRNFGIGMSLISQRPQEVNKKVLNLTELLFAFQLTGPQERKTVEGWIADKGIDEDIAGELPKLERGEPHVWSPAWLKISKRVKIDEKWTYDASSTPKVGKEAASRDLSPIDLDQLRTDMAATIEKAKAEDPRLLRQQIADLKRQLQKAPVSAVQNSGPTPAWRAEYEEAHARDTAAAHEAGIREGWNQVIAVLEPRLNTASQAIASAKEQLVPNAESRPWPSRFKPPKLDARSLAAKRVLDHVATMPTPRPPAGNGKGGATLAPAARKFLTALAQQARPLTRNKVAIFAGYSTASGHVDNTLTALRSAGYAVGDRDAIQITQEGIAALGHYDPLPTGEGLRAYWMRTLEPAASKFLAVLCEIYPSSIERDELAVRAGYSPASGHVDNTLTALRSRDLATGGRLAIKASEDLFS